MQRREVHYEGRVQGVGFRFRACQVAGRYRVTGFVMNLDDGRVRLVAEGEPDELDRFLDDLAETLRDNIRRAVQSTCDATGEFFEFQIQH